MPGDGEASLEDDDDVDDDFPEDEDDDDMVNDLDDDCVDGSDGMNHLQTYLVVKEWDSLNRLTFTMFFSWCVSTKYVVCANLVTLFINN